MKRIRRTKDPRRHSRMRELRENLGFMQSEMADKVGISVSQYSRYELRPDAIPQRRLHQIAQVLGVKPSELIDAEHEADASVATGHMFNAVPVFELRDGKLADDPATQVAPSFPYRPDGIGVLITDDSMDIPPGSILIGSTNAEPANGNLVLARDPGTDNHVVRRYVPLHPSSPMAPGYRLLADNPMYDEATATGKDALHGIVAVFSELHQQLLTVH